MVCYWVSFECLTLLFEKSLTLSPDHRTSQGIGLEIVKQLIAVSSHTVFAGCRNPDSAADLQALKTSAKGILHIVTLDVDSQESIQNAADATKALLGDRGVDYLINNAAIVSSFPARCRLYCGVSENFAVGGIRYSVQHVGRRSYADLSDQCRRPCASDTGNAAPC